MRNERWIGKKGLRYYYYKYRDSEYYALSMIGVTVVVSFLLVFQVIIPQFNQWFSIREQVLQTRERIALLEDNISFVRNLDRARLQNQLNTASLALPPDKDFGKMLILLTDASIEAGVSLSDYAFQVGDVASTSAKLSTLGTNGLDSTKITVVVNGEIDDVQEFIRVLERSIPMSEVVTIDGSGENISVTVQFYQKPYPDIKIADDARLQPISDNKVNLIRELNNWKQPKGVEAQPTGSESAVPLF